MLHEGNATEDLDLEFNTHIALVSHRSSNPGRRNPHLKGNGS